MVMQRQQKDTIYRWRLAHKSAFANIALPTATELNANPTNIPTGLIWNITCAVNTDGSQFDLDDPETDDSTTFCQIAGTTADISQSATVVIQYGMSKVRWTVASSVLAINGFNVANLTHSLLAFPDNTYYVVLGIGKDVDAAFVAGDLVSIVEVGTDMAIPEIATGDNIKWTQTMLQKTDIAWNVLVLA